MTSEEWEVRHRKGEVGALWGIVGNGVLAAGKLMAGVFGHSTALVADGIHTSADALSSVVVLVGIRVGKQPADADHPYGHGRAESIAAKIVALLLVVAGANTGWQAIDALIRGVNHLPGAVALWVALISVVLKEGMFWYHHRLGKEINSKAMLIHAWEHRSDALSSLCAAAGVAGARAGLLWLDPAAGIVVALFVMRIGISLSIEAFHELMDRQIDDEAVNQVCSTVRSIERVSKIDRIRIREAGPYVIVDIEIGIPADISVAEGHTIAHEVESAVKGKHQRVRSVMVHVNPVDQGVVKCSRA